jgi:hypothetical protein
MPRSRAGGNRVSKGDAGRHRALLVNPRVRSWYEARSLRSRLSADRYLRQLGLLLERLGEDADTIAGVAKENPDELRDRLVAYAADLKRNDRLDSYILKTFDALRSYLEHRRVHFEDFPKLSPIRGASLKSERVPTPEELGRVLEKLSLRGRVIALLMAHAGLRPGVVGSYGGENGLRLGDLADLKLGAELSLREVPFSIRVPAELSKTRVEYVTFGSRQLATALLAYLESRKSRGEKLSAGSPVVVPGVTRGAAKNSRDGARFGRGFLSTKAVVDELGDALKSSAPEGVRWRPYVARSYCSTRLLLAEGDLRISRDLREAILGHDGGVASRYNVGKRWGPELLGEARREYGRAASFLETTRSKGEPDLLREAKLLVLEAVGVGASEAAKLADGSKDAVLAEVRKRLGANASGGAESSRPSISAADGPDFAPSLAERAFPTEEVPKLLESGWRFVAPLNGSMAVLRAPS